MRVILKHNKSRQEAIQQVDKTSDELIQTMAAGPVQITGQKKAWKDNTMDFSFTAGMGFMSAPISGTVTVNEQDLVIDVVLPEILKKFIPEEKLRQQIESKASRMLQ